MLAKAFIGASCLVLLCACGGGGSGGSAALVAVAPVSGSKATAGPEGFAQVSFTVTLGTKSASAAVRKPAFVPASTTAVSVMVNTATPTTFPCTGPTCSGTFQAPAGAPVNFTFTALDSQARAVAESVFTQTIAANGVNALNVTLEGVVAHASLTLSAVGLSSAVAGQVTVSAVAYDVDNDVITGTYFAPLTLGVLNDTSGSITAGPAITSDTTTSTVSYAPTATTIYTENRVLIAQDSTTETAAQQSKPLEVGRTLYTWTSADTVVGFAPGSTTPTRTITIPATLQSPSSIACDGSNLYLADSEAGTLYAIAPTATTAVQYTSDSYGPVWVAANGGGVTPPNTQAQFFAANIDPPPLSEYLGTAGGPPFPLPPDSVASTPEGDGNGSQSDVVDKSGMIYTALLNPDTQNGGYEIFNTDLTLKQSVTDTDVLYGSDMIAIDQSVTPPRIFVEKRNANAVAEVMEYDNYSATPNSPINTDSADLGIFVDPAGNIYTSAAGSPPPPSVARRPAPQSRARPAARLRTQGSRQIYFDVYSSGNFSGTSSYEIPGNSLAFDSESYVYSNQFSGSIQVYSPGTASLVTTFPGTTYAIPNNGPYQFATFCR